MFNLNLLYVHQADREQRVEADLRRRQILPVLDEAVAPGTRAVAPSRGERRTTSPVRATGR